ncbi:Succinylglutamate desuccinylase/aspartoacylase [Candidatus Filomicrobium marinum]|uniref:Succinylglutamate desuccinylase/aspartoacylase n=1 Tax=Candidatus Filomicrobium marinum TaxID=1608628 RepID=A0A0D6JC14_9HYPH|nr:succinylglutamate desuccinylase/aspartoacylase family protein [Candidatus Filomicrobium marinum]CFX08941.1 Succinylglutamate desuccinylase/aspartoacylase [Candidatus Filomicrobium marinum]CPR16876.1 Succinylglutamate desuccinylase/aspartoacylase [Candidatus Filomicrobium marinum]
MRTPFKIGGASVTAGSQGLVDLPVAHLSNHTPVTLPIRVVHGRRDGPTLFVSAALHGDEILGVEIIRRLLNTPGLKSLQGTLLCVPIVNVFGFLSKSRYLPDGRDLNRMFPGYLHGSLAAQLAHLFMEQIARRSDFGIDLHSGSNNRANLPQLRVDVVTPELRDLAEAFGAPVILQSGLREGSLRKAAREAGLEVIVYEAGEALRLDEFSVRGGVRGILHVMHHLGMLGPKHANRQKHRSVFATSSKWIRAPDGGIFRALRGLGDSIAAGDIIGGITNPYEGTDVPVLAEVDGIIIGRTNVSVVNRADALFHVAKVAHPKPATGQIGGISDAIGEDPIFDEDEIV